MVGDTVISCFIEDRLKMINVNPKLFPSIRGVRGVFNNE
jgi:hypothetical protein